jgi:adenylylsulfate kinase-like enzyme
LVSPYEAPATPEIVVHTDREPVEASLGRILGYLRDRRLIDG